MSEPTDPQPKDDITDYLETIDTNILNKLVDHGYSVRGPVTMNDISNVSETNSYITILINSILI